MSKAMLIDTTRCVGCRGCQVACKSWNELAADRTTFSGTGANPTHLDANTFARDRPLRPGVTVWKVDRAHVMFWLELFGTVALPAALLGFYPEVRRSEKGLLWCAGLAVFGVVFNRFNVTMTAFSGYKDFTYFPSIGEIAVTVGFVMLGVLVFDLGARYLPVYGPQAAGEARPK